VAVPLEDRLVARLGSALDSRRVLALRGAQANLAELARLADDPTAILQFLVHGVRSDEASGSTALLLSSAAGEPDVLRREAVGSLGAPRLVVLTSCRSGLAPDRKGDPGLAGLGDAFLETGTQAVVQTSIDLTLGEAERLSEVLYRRLGAGDSPARALQIARQELVASAGAAAPLQSGLAQVVGLGQRVIFAQGERGARRPPGAGLAWSALGGVVCGALLAMLVLRRRKGLRGPSVREG
jgi:hypothetical protein